VILVFRLLARMAKYEPSHPMLFALAGVVSPAVLLVLFIVGAYVDRDRSSSQHQDFQKEQP
jgi:hypothetical protein